MIDKIYKDCIRLGNYTKVGDDIATIGIRVPITEVMDRLELNNVEKVSYLIRVDILPGQRCEMKSYILHYNDSSEHARWMPTIEDVRTRRLVRIFNRFAEENNISIRL